MCFRHKHELNIVLKHVFDTSYMTQVIHQFSPSFKLVFNLLNLCLCRKHMIKYRSQNLVKTPVVTHSSPSDMSQKVLK